MASKKTASLNTSELEKRANAVKKATRVAAWAKIMTKVVISQNREKSPPWHVINFRGPKKAESRGIVDMLAVRRNHAEPTLPLKRGDLFEIVLIQTKGGSAKLPNASDRERLRKVGAEYNAKAILLSEWKEGSLPKFYQLKSDDWIELRDVSVVFGKRRTPIAKSSASDTPSPAKTHPSAAAVVVPSKGSLAATKAWAKRR
jgi:hypothetical protein